MQAKSDAMVAVKGAFDAEGVGIPFPIVTLDLSEVDEGVFQGSGG